MTTYVPRTVAPTNTGDPTFAAIARQIPQDMVTFLHAQIDARVQTQVQLSLQATTTEVAHLRTAQQSISTQHSALVADCRQLFNFFALMMAIAGVVFIPVAARYRGQTHVRTEDAASA